MGRGYQDFPSKVFCLTVPKICVGGIPLVLLYFRLPKTFGYEGGESRFFIENYLSHSAEKHRRGTLLCFTNFGYRKSL